MNVRRFVGRNAREAMAQARAAFGDGGVVLSNRAVPGGVEILAMPGSEVAAAAEAPPAQPAAAAEPMSTMSFQDFVRERQRQEAALPADPAPRVPPTEPGRFAREALARESAASPATASTVLARTPYAAAAQTHPADELMDELRQMRSTITNQIAGLAWFDSVRRSPAQTRLLRLMIGNGFSPALARRFVDALPADAPDAEQWLAQILAHNLRCSEAEAIQQQGGVFALVGPTGVGKTTTTAKIAAKFALQHGAASVGLITVDTYRMAASDQLRAYGRILGIPVHTARDGAALGELLDLFVNKKLVLIDTVGLGQRDRRLPELFSTLPASRVRRLLVLNATAQGEMLDEVVRAYGGGGGTRCVITKLDEAVKCGAVVDVAVRHKLVVEGFANGQRVPEDWHAPRAPLLAQKALMKPANSAYLPDDDELGLLLTAPPARATRGELHA
ncbi:flagellar biosynthesis protein FlhF [Ramlibacter sp.]|uniref:flagellar biosynthesis protein FlhF n=1 Tax=Ramlibacter sp. TaxID=1917967 RepID=UPI003D135AD9